MKLGSIGSSLVRLFRRPATSVPPKIDLSPGGVIEGTKPEIDAILKRLVERALLTGQSMTRTQQTADGIAIVEVTPREYAVQIESGAVDTRPGIKPPLDTGTNGWTWSQWSKEAAGAGTIPGWAFCRFANRLGPESVGFVFGHVRGGFGVWRQPFDVCTSDHDGVQQRSEILTCVTHLSSGMGVGIFIDRDTAIMAAELAEKVCPSWQDDTPTQDIVWRSNMRRSLEAWHAIGICQSINAHAHDQHGTRFPIYGQDNESVMAGKPERLS